jgi:hypothetical protein
MRFDLLTYIAARLAAVVLIAGVLAAAPGARAAEVINDFFSRIEVEKSGDLIVTETIRVTAEGRRIRRGIFRDFPVRYLEPNGLWRHVGFKLLDVRRNGEKEDYHTEGFGDHIRIYIGKSDRLVRRGEHVYQLRYRTTRQLAYFKRFDEIFWNATGNFWRFPILRARAEVILPEGAKVLQKAAYTGRRGARGGNYAITDQTERSVMFETTASLRRFEGLSVAVGFPKGVIAEPSALTTFFWRFWDNLGLVILVLGAVAAMVYFLSIWQRVGKDPTGGVIIPLFGPPKGVSPAAASYIHNWGFRTSKGTPVAFVAALLSLAVKGRLKIVDKKGAKIALEKPDHKQTRSSGAVPLVGGKLPAGESVLESRFLGSREKFGFTKANGKTVKSTLGSFKSAILREHEGVFFRHNYGYLAGGIAISLVSLVLFFVLNPPRNEHLGLMITVFISGIIGSWLLFSGLWRLFGAKPGGGSRILGFIMAAAGTIILIPAALFPLAAGKAAPIAALFVAGGLGIMNVSFLYLLRAPTPAGRKVMDDLDGFKLYLSVAEAERLNMQGAPDMSAEIYERFLPYAIALGVEKPWSKAFSDHMKKIMPGREGGYQPGWYSGSRFSSGRLSTATGSISNSIAASTAASMPRSSGSGSSGGGGFSGGGGGGGGGGGW